MLNPFTPGQTVSLATSTATARVALPTLRGNQVRVSNPAGGQIVFLKFGDSSVTAAVTDFPVLPGESVTLTIQPSMSHVAGITSTGTPTIYFTAGDGR